jgi:2'-5' RNA ligase
VRLFVAVDVPQELKDAIETQVVGFLRDRVAGARWTRPEGRHLTLKFLGNVAEGRVGSIGEALRAAVRGHEPFGARFAEIGGFPTLRRPRVLWVGIGEGAEPMAALGTDIERALEPLGFEPEGRPFRGHLTLARFPRPRIVEHMPDAAVPADAFDVEDVVLFESRLHPKGANYTALERFRLGG